MAQDSTVQQANQNPRLVVMAPPALTYYVGAAGSDLD
jgi:hypothetical protein